MSEPLLRNVFWHKRSQKQIRKRSEFVFSRNFVPFSIIIRYRGQKKVDIFFLTFSFSVRLCPHCSAGGLLASNTVYRKKKKKKLLETLLPSYLPGSPIPQRRGGKVPSIKGRCCCAASSSKIDAHSGSSSARLAVMKSGHSRAISSFSLPPSSVIDVPSQQRIKKKKSCVRHAHNSLPIRLLQRVSWFTFDLPVRLCLLVCCAVFVFSSAVLLSPTEKFHQQDYIDG